MARPGVPSVPGCAAPVLRRSHRRRTRRPRHERPTEAEGTVERRQEERRRKHPEGDVRLADPQCEPALRPVEPLHHRPPTRAVDTGAEASCGSEEEDELDGAVCEADAGECHPGGREADGSTIRSPIRSARIPQGRSVSVIPIVKAESTTPVSASVRWKCAFTSGASTATLIAAADTVAWAAVPTPSTTHR